MRYEDASGLDYVHDGDSDISGDVVNLRYEFSDNNALSGLFMNSTRDTKVVCARYSGDPATTLPCGYGPGNTDNSNVQLYSLTDNALLGATQLQASVYSLDSSSLDNELARYVNGLPSPSGFSTDTKVSGYAVNASLPAQERHTISFQAYGSNSQFATTPLVPEAQEFYRGSQSTQYNVLQATDTIHSTDKLTLAESAGFSTATGNAGISELASTAATWKVNAHDTYSASFALSGAAATQGRLQILSDPATLRFDCNANVAYGNAPGDEPGTVRRARCASGTRINCTAATFRSRSIAKCRTACCCRCTSTASVLNELGQLPYGYLQQVQAIYDSPAGCGAPRSAPFTAQQLYMMTPIAGVQTGVSRRRGERVSDAGQSRRGTVLQSHRLGGQLDDYLFDNPYSITIPGQQLPNVPLEKSGIVLDYKAPHSILEWLADAQHVGSNNPNNLPAYTTYDAGVTAQMQTRHADLCRDEHHRHVFGHFLDAAMGGAVYDRGRFCASEYRAAADAAHVFVTYSVKFGQGAGRRRLRRRFTRAARVGGGLVRRGQRRRSGRPGRWSGGNGGRGGLRNFFSPLPAAPPADPFAVGANPQTCSATGGAAGAHALRRAERVSRADRSEENERGVSGDDAVARTERRDGGVSRPGCRRMRSRSRRKARVCCARWRAACRCISRAPTM